MPIRSDELPNPDEIARLLKSSQVKSVTVTSGHATVTMGPRLELESVQLGGPGIVAEHRAELERDNVDAVGRAMRDVVTASARMLEGLQVSAEMRSVREALEKEIGRSGGRDTKARD